MAKKKVEKKKKLEKAERKKLQKLVGEMMMPMFEKYQGEVRIYATKNGVMITPSENDADYPEMPESLALTGISKFLGIKNTIEVAQVSIDDKKLWVSRSLCPHLYVKTEEKTSDEKVDVDFSHIGEKDSEWDDIESVQDVLDDDSELNTTNITDLTYYQEKRNVSDNQPADDFDENDENDPGYIFYNIIANPSPTEDTIITIIEFMLNHLDSNGRRMGVRKLTSLLSVDAADTVRRFRCNKCVFASEYMDARYLFTNLLKVVHENNEALFSRIIYAIEKYFEKSEYLYLTLTKDKWAAVVGFNLTVLMNYYGGIYPFHNTKCYVLLNQCIVQSESSNLLPRLYKILLKYGDASNISSEMRGIIACDIPMTDKDIMAICNSFEGILRGFQKSEYYHEIIAMFSRYIKEKGKLYLVSGSDLPWVAIMEKDFDEILERINNEGEKA